MTYSPSAAMRPFPLDGALLMFDRDTGTNVLFEGAETAALRQRAPRSIQFGITNRCNLACSFCSRDVGAQSAWTSASAFAVLSDMARQGVLEVAFGGGEPFAFRGFEALVARLYDETPLAVHATTNGLLLDRERVRRVRGKIGELRLSIYEDNDWRRTTRLLAAEGVRFGVNLLVLPERLAPLEALVLEIVALGCRDVLLLSYNGPDHTRHLTEDQSVELSARVRLLHRAVGTRARIGLDVCWGERMAPVPRFLQRQDCGAGRDFVVVTSDKRVMACSFHHLSFPVTSANDILACWRENAAELAAPSTIPGCARVRGYGIGGST
jgi:MoaA/NifB/PqqE/SkfB family radical SAM enzyme